MASRAHILSQTQDTGLTFERCKENKASRCTRREEDAEGRRCWQQADRGRALAELRDAVKERQQPDGGERQQLDGGQVQQPNEGQVHHHKGREYNIKIATIRMKKERRARRQLLVEQVRLRARTKQHNKGRRKTNTKAENKSR